MNEVGAHHVDAVPTVVVRREVPAAGLPEGIPALIMPLFDEVYGPLPPGGLGGHNIVVYRPGADVWTIEVGMTVPPGADVPPGVTRSELPAGEVAGVVHRGPYTGIPESHGRVNRWIAESDRQPAGVTWEIYGDPEEDNPDLPVDVEIVHLLAPR